VDQVDLVEEMTAVMILVQARQEVAVVVIMVEQALLEATMAVLAAMMALPQVVEATLELAVTGVPRLQVEQAEEALLQPEEAVAETMEAPIREEIHLLHLQAAQVETVVLQVSFIGTADRN